MSGIQILNFIDLFIIVGKSSLLWWFGPFNFNFKLGVIFYSKLQWTEHVAKCSSKALKALNAIKLIKRYFTKTELLQLITSKVLSILYYNLEIWHLPNLKRNLKQKLLSVSANAI